MSVTITGDAQEIGRKIEDVLTPAKQGCKELMLNAQMILESAYSSQGENSDFAITLTEKGDVYTLTASGHDVGFLEFGAGIGVEGGELEAEVDFPVFGGSWSLLRGSGQYFVYGFWRHKGEKYTSITATRGMQLALDYIRDNAVEVIENAIRKWTSES